MADAMKRTVCRNKMRLLAYEVCGGSESCVARKKGLIPSLCILSGEIGRRKKSAENLFSLPICVIMRVAKKPSSGRKVAREA